MFNFLNFFLIIALWCCLIVDCGHVIMKETTCVVRAQLLNLPDELTVIANSTICTIKDAIINKMN